ncbi:hypothetical protein OESDEN_03095 [Oesophagostomum dentatum]|uniref:Uncharacterized protein n=1 Tax=Oesophagostomum dentatum TaxID=61180 RepID=A0A0B1TI43_OESDE|nr:hypothetical protein OESDEN_03095 [Oesophagostomum dentatum]
MQPLGDCASVSRPRFVRLANGKLARITTKRIPASQVQAKIPQLNPTPAPTITNAEALDNNSAPTNASTSPDAIDASKLIGSEPATDSDLFERDLVRIADEPLFNPVPSHYGNTSESCTVCRKLLPGMKKHLLSVEARLGSLVDIVQNLIIHINPKDREAAAAAKASAAAAEES